MRKAKLFAVFALSIGFLTGVSVCCYHYFYPEKYVQTADGTYVNTTVAGDDTPFPIDQNTTFEMIYYDKETDRTLTEEIDSIPALLGCDKSGVERYLKDYMRHLSKEEQEEGLTSFTLVSYTGNRICLRKTYEKETASGYYAKSYNGYVVILNGDEKTVYEYTQISIHLLPDEIRERVLDGYYLENEKALYGFLENYSS